jgi:hypothetical protein
VRETWHRAQPGVVVLATLAVLGVAPMKAEARDKLSGRFNITYQNADRPAGRYEYLSERFEATLRDRVFERNDLALTFYFDNARDLSSDQTFRRYRGLLNLQNPIYTFSARYTPRQEITPIELPNAVELVDKQLLLHIHPQNAPQLRLSYGGTERFEAGIVGNKTTNWRGDIFYNYHILSLGLNRYRTTSENATQRTTDVTGGDVRLTNSYGPRLTFDVGYQYQLTESDLARGLPQDVTNHNFTGVLTSRYRRLLQGTLTLNRRYLSNDTGTDVFKTTDDNDLASALFFPMSPVTFEYYQTFVRTEADTLVSQTSYGSAQILGDGKVWRNVTGHVQMTRRFDTNTIEGVIPDHIYFARLESRNRRGVDVRGELGVLERVQEGTRRDRYSNTSMLDMYLRPWNNMTLVPRVQYIRFSDNVAFTGNDQSTYSLTGTWGARIVNFGLNLNHSAVQSGRRSVSNAATFNISAGLRGKSSFSASYGVRETDAFATSVLPEEYSKSRTLSLWGQLWVLPRGSLSVNYTNVDPDNGRETNYVALNYRQEF